MEIMQTLGLCLVVLGCAFALGGIIYLTLAGQRCHKRFLAALENRDINEMKRQNACLQDITRVGTALNRLAIIFIIPGLILLFFFT